MTTRGSLALRARARPGARVDVDERRDSLSRLPPPREATSPSGLRRCFCPEPRVSTTASARYVVESRRRADCKPTFLKTVGPHEVEEPPVRGAAPMEDQKQCERSRGGGFDYPVVGRAFSPPSAKRPWSLASWSGRHRPRRPYRLFTAALPSPSGVHAAPPRPQQVPASDLAGWSAVVARRRRALVLPPRRRTPVQTDSESRYRTRGGLGRRGRHHRRGRFALYASRVLCVLPAGPGAISATEAKKRMPANSPKKNAADHTKSAAVTTRNSSATKSSTPRARDAGVGTAGARLRVRRRELPATRLPRALLCVCRACTARRRRVVPWISARVSLICEPRRVSPPVHGRDDGEGDERGRRLALREETRELTSRRFHRDGMEKKRAP